MHIDTPTPTPHVLHFNYSKIQLMSNFPHFEPFFFFYREHKLIHTSFNLYRKDNEKKQRL